MDADLAQKAVSAALSANWKQAITLNKQILKEDSKNIDALNRLARAYAEVNDFKKARKLAEKALKLDPFNTIAEKALKKWKGIKKGGVISTLNVSKPEDFLEEPGKTKIVPLLYLGDPKLISEFDAGDEVKMASHSHRVNITTPDGKYLGRLPDDLSARLRKLIKYGNDYQVLIKSITPDDVKVFIREIKRSDKLLDTASFPAEKIDYISFTPPELVRRKENLTEIEAEEEL